MQKAPPQHAISHTQAPAQPERGLVVESRQSEHLAPLAATMANSSQAGTRRELAALMHASPALAAQRKSRNIIDSSPGLASLQGIAGRAQNNTARAMHGYSGSLNAAPRIAAQRRRLEGLFGAAPKPGNTRSPLQLQTGVSQPAAVVQAKWKDMNDVFMVWDRPLGGLRWYFNKDTGLMSFEIVTMPDDEDLIAHLARLKREEHTYPEWIAIWGELGWIEPGGASDLSFYNEATGEVEWYQEPDVPLDWEWWLDKSPYREELEPRPLPEYRQLGANSCAIEGMRMVVEGLTGIPVDREDLLGYLDDDIMPLAIIKSSGIPFHTLPQIFDDYFGMSAVIETAKDTEALAGFLDTTHAVMLEVSSHVIVVDSVSGTAGHRTFAIRDPAVGAIERVAEDDARLKGTGRIVVISG